MHQARNDVENTEQKEKHTKTARSLANDKKLPSRRHTKERARLMTGMTSVTQISRQVSQHLGVPPDLTDRRDADALQQIFFCPT